MTSSGKLPSIEEEQRELLDALEEWEARQPKPPNIFDVIENGDVRLIGAFVLRGFRQAASEAVEGHRRVTELRDLAYLAFGAGDSAEEFLRAAHPCLNGQTPLEATLASTAGRDRAIRALSPHVRGVAMRAFDRLCKVWVLSEEDQRGLLGISAGVELDRWREDPVLIAPDAIERISVLLGVFRAINVLLPSPTSADEWIRRPNKTRMFAGGSALEFMLERGLAGMYDLRGYLDGEIGGS